MMMSERSTQRIECARISRVKRKLSQLHARRGWCGSAQTPPAPPSRRRSSPSRVAHAQFRNSGDPCGRALPYLSAESARKFCFTAKGLGE
jgi:hypothetical protein